jgi:hypothetical protein
MDLSPSGLLIFWGRRADAPVLPRYFFVLAYPDRELRDPGGAIFSSDEAAIEAARKVIDELLAERQPEDPNPTIVVKNAAGEIVYQYPSTKSRRRADAPLPAAVVDRGARCLLHCAGPQSSDVGLRQLRG